MFNTIRSKLIALVLMSLAVALLIGGVGLYGNSRLEVTANRAAGYGLAAQNQMMTDMLHDNLRGVVEQYVGAVKDKSPERITSSAKSLVDNAKNIRVASHANDNSTVLGPTSKAFIAKLTPIFDDYAKSAEAIAALSGTDLDELERGRATFSEKFSVLEKEQELFNEWLQTEIEKTKELSDQVVQSSFSLLAMATIVGVASLLVVAIFMYLSITTGLEKLKETISKVNEGDSTARAKMSGADELSVLGRSFDALLDERIATLEVKNTENENINNSAINLLQTVFALSEKNLTARADVTDDIVGTIASSVNQFADETAQTLAEVQQIANQVRGAAQDAQKQGLVVEGAASRERTLLDSMGETLGSASRQLNEVAQLSTASSVAAARL